MQIFPSEPGCIMYELFENYEDAAKTEFAMIEHWLTKESLDAHLTTKHVGAFRAAVKDVVVDAKVRKYTTVGV